MRETFDAVVVGGGPAGSTAAAIAARRGLSVLLLEAGVHPRPHVGESLLPGIIPILEEMGALAAVESAGFRKKTGSTHHDWGQTPRWDLWLRDSEAYDHAWLVDRARFDAILFDAAGSAGARVESNARCEEVLFADTEGVARAVGVRWRRGAEVHEAHAPFVIDASGQAGLLARRLSLREPIEGLRHLAAWAHFEGAQYLPPPRDQQAWFLASVTHWTWMFPFGEGRCSIGIVTLDGRTADYDALVTEDARLMEVVGPGLRRVTPVRWERDWSYRHREVAGPGWLCVGDAAGFIDPVLSTGVLLAMHAGWAAARAVADVRAGIVKEDEALASYATAHRRLFGDLLRIVRFFYEQNVKNEDYFWQAKSILLAEEDWAIKPQRAFVVLTSGLIGNLAFDERRDRTARERTERTGHGADLRTSDEPTDDGVSAPPLPDTLGFVCLALRCASVDPPATLYFLVEPSDPAAPTLFRSAGFDVNCLAPRFGNDPIRVPALAPPLRALFEVVRQTDTVRGEPLATFWRRLRGPLAEAIRALPPDLTLLRVFGK